MEQPHQFHADHRDVPFVRLEDRDLEPASRCIVQVWSRSFDRVAGRTDRLLHLHEFGVLGPYLAEAVVADHGGDFVFPQWGGALDTVCGGAHCGHRLSTFPQPSRSHLRRVCVRAAATRMPAVSRETWALGGDIWRCRIMALPTDGDDFSATRLLVALFFAPHPIVAASAAPEGLGWPAAMRRGSAQGPRHGMPEPPPAASAPRPLERAFQRLGGWTLKSLLKGLGGRA